MADDYYQMLGVGRDASREEIQKAYRTLARQFHPDLNPDKSAKKRFQEVQRAFDVLNDPQKRELYDRYGSSFESVGAGPARGGPPWKWQSEGGPGGFEDFDFSQAVGDRFGDSPFAGFADLFSQVRRASESGARRARATGRERGEDVHHLLEIPLATSVSGGEAEISVRRASGKVDTLRVKIPAGIDEGKEIRLRGQGERAPAGGPAGDLLIRLRVSPHPWFQRRGNNLLVKVPVTLAEAAVGAKVNVPSPYGTVKLTVPAGSSSGTRLRIKGQGVRPKDAPPGDLLAEVMIVLPPALDEESLQMIRAIDQKHLQDPRHELRW